MDDARVEDICEETSKSIGEPVVAANYNCIGQLVISGNVQAVDAAMVSLKAAGCRLAKRLPVSGAFHSPLMQSAYEPLADALSALEFQTPEIPVYSNYTAMPTTDPALLKSNALNQLLNPVRWTQTLVRMYDDDARSFTECGPGNVLRGLVQRTLKDVDVQGVE
jgi:[acyl-carrier-protein] S-malonyltransferase